MKTKVAMRAPLDPFAAYCTEDRVRDAQVRYQRTLIRWDEDDVSPDEDFYQTFQGVVQELLMMYCEGKQPLPGRACVSGPVV